MESNERFVAFQVEVSAEGRDFSDFEEYISNEEILGLDFQESEPSDPLLRASHWESIAISIASAGGLKVVRDVLLAYLTTRKTKLTIRNSKTGNSVIFEGPVKNQKEAEELVKIITTPESQGRSKS